MVQLKLRLTTCTVFFLVSGGEGSFLSYNRFNPGCWVYAFWLAFFHFMTPSLPITGKDDQERDSNDQEQQVHFRSKILREAPYVYNIPSQMEITRCR